MHSILRQALMRHHGAFFGMSEEEQTLFKLQDHDDIDKKIKEFIKDKLGMKHGERKNSPEQILEYNTINLPYIGIGPNSFVLSEWIWNEKILRFKSLYEANKDNHEFQESSNVKDFKGYEAKELFNRINDWARAFVDDEFYYLNLFSYQIWLYYDIEDISFKWFEENIPHDYVSGPNDGKETKGGTIWDMVLDANGQEGWYDHMSEFSRNWNRDKYDADILDDSKFGNSVYIVDGKNDDPTDPALNYIFGSMEVLRDITYLNFVNDCEKAKGDPSELFDLKITRAAEFSTAMDKEFERIKQTMKPDEVMKKEKRKVVVADGAFDGIM